MPKVWFWGPTSSCVHHGLWFLDREWASGELQERSALSNARNNLGIALKNAGRWDGISSLIDICDICIFLTTLVGLLWQQKSDSFKRPSSGAMSIVVTALVLGHFSMALVWSMLPALHKPGWRKHLPPFRTPQWWHCIGVTSCFCTFPFGRIPPRLFFLIRLSA